jgi:hypothetical protein
MSRCVCTHIRALHVDGVCQARIQPCGCTSYEPPEQADRPSSYSRSSRDEYSGTYTRRYKA